MEPICTKLEIRIYIIGDSNVGKKAIANRLQILNSTSTTQNNYFVKLPQSTSPPSKNSKLKPPETNLSQEERGNQIKELRRLKFMTSTKEFVVGKQVIDLHFFPIQKGEPVEYTGKEREKDEDFEFEKRSKFSLKKLKKEIKSLISFPPKAPNTILEHFFMFVFDLGNFVSFEKLILYYSELNKQFNLNTNYQTVWLGNKLDQKTLWSDEEKTSFEEFRNKTNMKYYEISSLMFFNFESFFEVWFNDYFVKLNPEFGKDTFKNRLHLLLSLRPDFPRAERNTFKFDESPSPLEYNTDIYAIPTTKAQVKQTFADKKTRFKTRIFVNKLGPLFPTIVKEKYELYTKDKDTNRHSHNLKREGLNDNFTSLNDVKKMEWKEVLGEKWPGYSCGIKAGSLNLKKSRRELKKQQNLWWDEAWDDDTVIKLHIKSPPKIKDSDDYDKYIRLKLENLESKRIQMHTNENSINEVHSEILKAKEKEWKKKIIKIKEKEEKYTRILEENELKRSHSKQQSSASTNRGILPISTTPGPNAYDIRGDLVLKTNFSWRQRFPESKRLEAVPQFHNFRNEFEDLVQRGLKLDHDRMGKKFGERFPEQKIVYPEEPTQIYRKWEQWETNKRTCAKTNEISEFIDKRKKRCEKAYNSKLDLQEKYRMEIEHKITQQMGEDQKESYLLRDIKYNWTEDQSPKFSIKGRYEHGGIFDAVGGKEEKSTRMNIMQTQVNKRVEDDRPPDFNKIRPNLPHYSFGKSSRFPEREELGGEYRPQTQDERLFATGEFKPNDCKSYLVKEVTMGTSNKQELGKDNGVPGPGLYKLKGFAEEIAERGAVINEIRTAIREKEKAKLAENIKIEDEKTMNGNSSEGVQVKNVPTEVNN